MKTRQTALSALLLALMLSACATEEKKAAAPAPTVPGMTAEQGGMVSPKGDAAVVVDLVSQSATVKTVDLKTRLVTLIGADGRTFVVKADEKVRNLPQVRAGDKVTLELYEGLAAQLTPPGAPVEPRASEGIVRAAPGERPGVAAAEVVTKTVQIDFIDYARHMVQFHDANVPDDPPRTIAVKKPEFRAMLKTLKTGDRVTLSYFEAVAVSVTPMAQ
jgi:uncharacterized lipoprotein YbaY